MTLGSAEYYPRIALELQTAGREDLVPVIQERIEEAEARSNRIAEEFKRFERDRLGGFLRRTKRRLLG